MDKNRFETQKHVVEVNLENKPGMFFTREDLQWLIGQVEKFEKLAFDYDDLILKVEELKEENEKLILQNMVLQPVYSRRMLIEMVERYEKGLKLANRRLMSMCGMSDNPRRPTLDDCFEIYTIIRNALEG